MLSANQNDVSRNRIRCEGSSFNQHGELIMIHYIDLQHDLAQCGLWTGRFTNLMIWYLWSSTILGSSRNLVQLVIHVFDLYSHHIDEK